MDVYGNDDKGERVGLQCKNTWKGLSANTIDDEVAKAEKFMPPLAKLYVATTAPTDKALQEHVRNLSDARRKTGRFEVAVWFWNDVWQDLSLDEERTYQHFPHLKPKPAEMVREPKHDLRSR